MAGKSILRKIYWDTCIFLAWIKQETCWPDDVMKGIEQIVEQSLAKQVVIITSVITLAEILQSKMTIDEKARFTKAFSDPRLQLVDVDRRISSKAATIRQDCITTVLNTDGSTKSGSIMAMGDALHLATAIHFKVDEFQTLDGAGRAKRLDLLRLDGNVALSSLAIRQPRYVPPPPPLEGPLRDVSGAQMRLTEAFVEIVSEEAKTEGQATRHGNIGTTAASAAEAIGAFSPPDSKTTGGPSANPAVPEETNEND